MIADSGSVVADVICPRMIAELAHELSRVTHTCVREPATSQQITELRAAYPEIPDCLIQLLTFANGEVDPIFRHNGMIAFEAFYGCEEIVSYSDFATSYSAYGDLNQFVQTKRIDKSTNWHEGLIPISFGYDAHIVCIDMEPGADGLAGQILALRPITGNISVISNSLEELLTKTLELYRAKNIDFADDDCPLLTLEDFPEM